ncbi:hypothetical protein GCM10010339_04960 [Streptomyces alanosinicus]|uniref:Uncharacterized protein n=1 Tax=Streptomyces alanosinicus TaxID=68171 RepID=A0A918YC85_9ACTN|nr:hypothetical protein GCM10010339_04960 [Streptomyces alanosinicus]
MTKPRPNFHIPYDGERRRGVALRRTVDILLSQPEPAPGGGLARAAGETFGKQCTPVSRDTGAECAAMPRCHRIA